MDQTRIYFEENKSALYLEIIKIFETILVRTHMSFAYWIKETIEELIIDNLIQQGKYVLQIVNLPNDVDIDQVIRIATLNCANNDITLFRTEDYRIGAKLTRKGSHQIIDVNAIDSEPETDSNTRAGQE